MLIDGVTYTGTEFAEVVSPGNNSGLVNKPGELIQIDDNNLIAFYNLSGDLNNFYYRLIEFGIASARLTLINKSSISTNINTALSNISAEYDDNSKLVRFVFMTSLTVAGVNYNNLIYTESPFVDGNSLLKIMALGIKCGESIKVQVEGDTEEATAAALQAIVESTDH